MSTSTTEIANSVMICKQGHVRCPMATSKPFVVCSVATKRYAPSTKGVSRDDSLPAVVPNAGPRRPQPSRFAPSKPFLVCSLSTKRYAPSKRASTNTPITYHDAMSPSSSPDLSSFLSQSCRVVPSLNRCSYRRSNVPSRHPHPIDFPSATFSPSTFAIVNAFTPSQAKKHINCHFTPTTLSPFAIAALPLRSSRTASAANIRYTITSTPHLHDDNDNFSRQPAYAFSPARPLRARRQVAGGGGNAVFPLWSTLTDLVSVRLLRLR
ncbi:hypothetical protein L210DRAFT_3655958 [Boletus edulis BED1]|uniref:Uncharacterized protein n=1 Tax=Boletus edulis BED1 TaxID=1328754 RepID=A0AAD4BCB2_BOLED|nr:hypothetical protein L210DRAFT_3655958 [Boletus edulis BED1]